MFEGLCEKEKCQKTAYIVQFLWRDLSSKFYVVGPYYSCSSSLETQSLYSMVVRTMLALSQFGFLVRVLLCDGASSNLSLLDLLCGYSNNQVDITQPSFKSPFDWKSVHLIICPSHQVNTGANYINDIIYKNNYFNFTVEEHDCCIVQLKM